MSDVAIRVENISKRYRIGLKEEMHDTFFGMLSSWAKSPVENFLRVRSLSKFDENGNADDIIWALRDVSFEVKHGEVLGIIGRNGAGKSTLLKILCRITEPTSGRAFVNGRVASLLEVGTGFHQELTGRENVYLNGTILGMSKTEIDRKFDEIVDFSGVERFIDTPVKRYSSGMKVRLAFAVAAHLEPEILLIDEVLAVGDAEFQKRCLGKMGDIAKGGRTVLFVSHNMAMIQNLCSNTMILDGGKEVFKGDTNLAISNYLGLRDKNIKFEERLALSRDPKYSPIIKSVELLNTEQNPTDHVPAGGELTIKIEYSSPVRLRNPTFGILIETMLGQRLIPLQTKLQHGAIKELPQNGVVFCNVPSVPLTPGQYYLSFGCSANGSQIDRLERVVNFYVDDVDYFGTGHLPKLNQGFILVSADWSFSG